MELKLTGSAVTVTLRYAYERGDLQAMREICGGVTDERLEEIGKGDAEVRGDSVDGFSLWTIDRRYLVPTLIEGEPIPRAEWIEITGRSDRQADLCESGILRSMSDKYFLDDVAVPGEEIGLS